MQIVWSDSAKADYHQNIEYLLSEWSFSVAREFIDDVEGTLELIKKRPDLYHLTEFSQVRKAVIRRQVSLFYKVIGTEIHLLRFWNNYRDPHDLKFQ